MSIHSLLTHRCTVERASEQMVNGTPVRSWSVVTVRCPVLLSRDDAVTDPTWTASEQREASSTGTLFALPSSGLLPGDRVHVTRPPMAGSFEILPDPADVMTLHSVSHREFKVRSVG